jgi:type VI secretion system secreted protein Hcp
MSVDTHIKFDGVDGEATHKDHKNEIELLSWSWGVMNASSASQGGGSGRGKATANDFVITHNMDKASPVLAKACASGKHFKTAVLTARKAGEGQQDFLKVIMKEVFITSVQPAGAAGGDIVEQVTMTAGDIEFEYKPQDSKGALGGGVKFGWDMKTTETR